MNTICIRAGFALQLCCKLSTVYSTAQCGAQYDKVLKEANTSVGTFSFRTVVSFKMVPANEQVVDDIVQPSSHLT